MLTSALTPARIEDFLHCRLPEAETLAFLQQLSPEALDEAEIETLLSCFIDTIRQDVHPVPRVDGPVMDCCGTGGSGLSHYNTSTTVAFVLAAAGVRVVKFGNRAISSRSGSFDFLEALGFPANAPPESLPEVLDACGLAFLFAPQCYPAFAQFNALRKRLGVRSIFNYLGPLLNPVNPAYRLLGVSHEGMQAALANHLAQRSENRRALVVRGESNLDEIAHDGVTFLLDVHKGDVEQDVFESLYTGPSLNGVNLSPADSAAIFHRLIGRQDAQSPYHHMVCLNVGAGLFVAGQARDIESGAQLAAELLANGQVRETYEQCRRAYADLAG